MSNMVLRQLVFLSVFMGALVGCGKKDNKPQIFYGKCRLEIQEKSGKAELRVDGITVGSGQVALQVPCSEKRVTAVLAGRTTYEQYYNVEFGKPLKVEIEMKEHQKSENFALSRKLVAQVRSGQKIDMSAEVAPIKDPAPGSLVGQGGGGGAAAAGAATGGQSNLNPDGSCALWCAASDWM